MNDAKDRVLGTMRRVLEQTTLRAILRPLGRVPLDVSESEKEALLEPFRTQIENDFVMCCEIADQLVRLSHSKQEPEAQPQTEPVELVLSTED